MRRRSYTSVLLASVTAGLLATVLAPTPAASAAGPVSIASPVTAPRGTVVTVTGTADPGAQVDVFFRRQGTTAYLDLRDLVANAQGAFRTTFTAATDYAFFARSGGRASAIRSVRAVGTTIQQPPVLLRGSVGVLRGLARPGTKVDVFFRAAGTTAFIDYRDVTTSGSGAWATTFRADRDFQVYARSAEGQSARPVARVVYATISGPAHVARNSTVVLTGTARPGAAVGIWFRKSGWTIFVLNRTVTANAAGVFRTSYVATANYAYYAVANGVRSAPRATTIPAFTFSDGTRRVGSALPPGTYRTRSNVSGCYWERLSGFSGGFEDILANEFTNAHTVVTIRPSDAGLRNDGCGTFTANLSPITTSRTAAFGNGTWIVGTDIAPGIWRSVGGSGCYWERMAGFSGDFDELTANDFGSSYPVVTISASDRGFKTQGCSNWYKVG
jgi:hypothetical protein